MEESEQQKQRQTTNSKGLSGGVTQANGLENEIVKLIEARIKIDRETAKNSQNKSKVILFLTPFRRQEMV